MMIPKISFTIINIFCLCLILLNTTFITTILLNSLRHHRRIVLLLITNTYISMLMFAVILLISYIDILIADLYGSSYASFRQPTLCKFQGTIMYGALGNCYMTFALQAVYRCIRIVFHRQRSIEVCNTFCLNLTKELFTCI